MDTKGATIAVIDTDESWGTTVKILIGFIIGLFLGIIGTWLVMRNHSEGIGNSNGTATSTQTTGNTVTNATGSQTTGSSVMTTSGGSSLVPSGEFSVVNQKAGDTVSVDKVAFGEGGGWVVVHEDDNGKLGRALGAAWFGQGSWNGQVSLLRATQAGKTYHAVLYTDNSNKQFSLSEDRPFVSQTDGKVVEQVFKAE